MSETTPEDQPAPPCQSPAEAASAADTACPPAAAEEIEARTARGVAAWLKAGVALFWGAVLAVVLGMTGDRRALLLLGYCGVLASFVVALLGYLFALLEPAAFASRTVKLWLSASFGSLVLFSALLLAMPVLLPGGSGETAVQLAVRGAGLLASVAGLAISLVKDSRPLFVIAFVLLLAASIPW